MKKELKIFRDACRKAKCRTLDMFKRAWRWHFKRRYAGPSAIHAHSIFQSGGSLHAIVLRFIRSGKHLRIAT